MGERLEKALADVDDDPRLTVTIVGWLRAAKWPGSSAAYAWSVMLARLVSLRDARAIAPLEQVAKDLPPFLGAGHRQHMVEEIEKAAKALARKCASLPRPPEPDAAFAELEGLLEEPAADFFAPRPKGPDTALRLVQRVWENPDDDDLRRVTADALLEAGEPWGELIMLQFQPTTPATRKQVEALLGKHGRVFCGPLAKVVKVSDRVFEKGFLVEVTTNGARMGRLEWEAAAAAPHWATVRRVNLDMEWTPPWWVAAWAKNPATRNLLSIEIRHVRQLKLRMERERGGPFTVTRIAANLARFTRPFAAFVSALPREERAAITIADVPHATQLQATLVEAQR
jgi:uncharacterized protein (TIGR02996 family)